MKKSFSYKVLSVILLVVMFVCITTTSYAKSDNTLMVMNNNSAIVAPASQSNPVYIEYAGVRSILSVPGTYGAQNYQYINTMRLADDNRVHRIIYDVYFKKDASDAGVGNVQITVKFVRNGTIIHQCVIPYSSTENGYKQVEVPGVSKNDIIDVYIDTGSENSATANGAIRKVSLLGFNVYTD